MIAPFLLNFFALLGPRLPTKGDPVPPVFLGAFQQVFF
jgi:hypothetical protein